MSLGLSTCETRVWWTERAGFVLLEGVFLRRYLYGPSTGHQFAPQFGRRVGGGAVLE